MRTRLLRPGFFENEELAALEPHARLLFAGLWLMADREGRLKDRPDVIRSTLFAFEPHVDVATMLQALHKRGFIRRYRGTNRVKCVQIKNFAAHQYPHYREPVTKLPAPRKSPRLSLGPSPGPSPRPSPLDTDTDTDTYKIKPAAPVHSPPFKIYAAIASQILAATADLDLDPGAVAEEFKRACAKRALPYDATIVQKALDAA